MVSALQRAGLLQESYPAKDYDPYLFGLAYDNREVKKGDLFVCKGRAFREEYLDGAISRGIRVYVSEKAYIRDFPHLLVKDIRLAMAVIARVFYGDDAASLCKIGITGTKGKTTVSALLHSILNCACETAYGCSSALISSLTTYDGTESCSSRLSTPEAFDLWRHLSNAGKNHFRYAVCEVSSQALKYHRVDGVDFDIVAFLNIGEDHISAVEHENFEDYFSSKLKLFSQGKTACLNRASDRFDEINAAARAAGCRVVTFGFTTDSDLFCAGYKRTADGMSLTVRWQNTEETYSIRLPGRYNVENALAAIVMAKLCGVPQETIAQGLCSVEVPGRGGMYQTTDGKIHSIVDYAHNRMSLNALLDFVAEEYPEQEIVAVFGCPGGKARNRRKDLGLLAGSRCSGVILTEDDPAGEPLETICNEIAFYVRMGTADCTVVYERPEAIQAAFDRLEENGGVILVCGKGVENTQKRADGAISYATDGYYVEQCIKKYNEKRLAYVF